MPTTYSLDTSVVVLMNREMPRDIHDGLWRAFDALASEKRMYMTREAYEELLVVGDECAPWAKSFDSLICDASNEEVEVVARISAAHPGWINETDNAADPWVIANASVYGRTVLTQEKLKGPGTSNARLKIPNVCAELSVPYVNLNQLARDEQWRF